MRFFFSLRFSFSFFNSHLSPKFGKPCCRYNQNSQPLSSSFAQSTFNSLKPFLSGWKLAENSLFLTKVYYVEDYRKVVDFLGEMIRIDAENTRNCPSFKMEQGELLTLEVYSPKLGGLSQIDFELAMKINTIKCESFGLIEVTEREKYKEEVNLVRFRRESEKIQKQLNEEEGKMKN